MSVYYATKAYVLSFSEALAEELRGTDVTVTTLCPGPTATGFESAASMGSDSAMFRHAADAARVAREGYVAMRAGKNLRLLYQAPGLWNHFHAAELTREAMRAAGLPDTTGGFVEAHAGFVEMCVEYATRNAAEQRRGKNA